MFRIPIYQPSLGGREREYVLDCVDSTWISSHGKYVGAFEQAFARYTGIAHATAVCNGTAALHIALLALGIGPGDEVIVPTLTYIASVNAIRYTGATPVFADSLANTWQIDPADVARRITPRTKCILAVHLYGHPCDMKSLVQLADAHGLHLIEDCAEAVGSRVGARHVGSFGRISAYSFYGNKTITTGEGGMVLVDDPQLAARVRHLRGQGLAEGREYWHDIIGYNYRMTNICAAIGLAQLDQVTDFLARKRAIAGAYRDAVAGSAMEFHAEAAGNVHSYWMCSILVPQAVQRDQLRRQLADSGIETRPVFHPVHMMPMYRKPQQGFPVAEDLAARGINLPSWPGMTDAQLGEVATLIGKFARSNALRA